MRAVNIMSNQRWVGGVARVWPSLLSCLAVCLLFSGPVLAAEAVNKLIAVSVDAKATAPTVLVETAEPVGYRYTVYDSSDPMRVVIDFPGVDMASVAPALAVNKGSVQEIRVSRVSLASGPLARVEILLSDATEYQVNLEGKQFRVTFAAVHKASPAPTVRSAQAVEPAGAAPIAEPARNATLLSNVALSAGRAVLASNGRIDRFQSFTLTSPPRLVVDIYGVSPGFKERSFAASGGFSVVRVGADKEKTRLVFDASTGVLPDHLVEARATDLLVSWGAGSSVTSAQPEAVGQAVAAKAPASIPARSTTPANVEAIDFKNEDGRSVISVALSSAADDAKITGPVQEGNLVRFEIINATLSRALRRTIDASAFPGAVKSVTPYTVADGNAQNVRIAVDLKGAVAYALERDGAMVRLVVDDGAFAEPAPPAFSQVAVAAPVDRAASAATVDQTDRSAVPVTSAMDLAEGGAGEGQRSYAGETVSLDFIDANVRMLLRLIADVSGLNIVASERVGGTMTLRLVDVPWTQALDLILTTNGLKMKLDGNIAHIMTNDEFVAAQKAETDARQAELDAKVNYQEATQKIKVTETVKIENVSVDNISDLAGMNPNVTLTVNKATKSVVVSGNQPDVEEMLAAIKEVDKPEKQVLIEVRIVEANTSKDLDFGVRWGSTFQSDEDINSSYDLNNAVLGLGGSFALSGDEGTGFLDRSGAGMGISFGKLGVTRATLAVRLSALEGNGDVKIVSTPRILTLNGNAATITQGRQIPYTTTDESGSPKTEFIDAVLDLTVTPEINPNNSIILDLDLKNDSQGPNVASGAGVAPAIEKKTAKSKILVRDGETTVIGGIFVESEDESYTGVPIAMDLPVLGHLFKSTNKKASRNELLIFITPRVVE